MTAEEFLKQYIAGYLFTDLKTMLAAEKQIPDNKDGHLGYPLVMSCAAGIEVIGVLLTNTAKDKDFENGAEGFKHYWSTYLYRTSPNNHAGYGVYQLARSGIAHNFAAKHINVWTRAPDLHLRLDDDGVPNIDAAALAKDFMESYEYHFTPTFQTHSRQMDDALNRLQLFNEAKIGTHLKKALGQLHRVSKPTGAEITENRFPTSSLPSGASSKGSG